MKRNIDEKTVRMDFPRLCVIRNNRGACALTVLAAVARYYGRQFTKSQFEYIFELANVQPGLDSRLFSKYLAPLGIRHEERTGSTIEDIRDALRAGIPCAVSFSPLEDSHKRMNMTGCGHLAAAVGVGEKCTSSKHFGQKSW